MESKLTAEQSAEILRMVLPLLSRNDIPANPENYTIWYHYVLGDIQELNNQIDAHLTANSKFSPQFNAQLFKQFFEQFEMEKVEEARQKLQSTLDETNSNLGQQGEEAEHYNRILDNFSLHCDKADSVDDVMGVLRSVLKETQLMRDSMDQMRNNFDARTTELNKLREELDQVRHKASTDPLTGLANRGTLLDVLESQITSKTSDPGFFSLIIFDIDHFKRVNDTYGHVIGDKVIRFVADILKKSTKGKDTAARYGGEEFALVLPNTSLDGGMKLAEQIRNIIAGTNLVKKTGGESLGRITISGGVAQYRAGEEIEEFINRADQALYNSKNRGRNQVTQSE